MVPGVELAGCRSGQIGGIVENKLSVEATGPSTAIVIVPAAFGEFAVGQLIVARNEQGARKPTGPDGSPMGLKVMALPP
jgi:hypothetical protein